MNNQIYFSHSYAGDQRTIDLIRRFLRKKGYEVIEHTGTWTEASMQKFLDCSYKLILPLEDYVVGRGQAEMIEKCLARELAVYVIEDWDTSNSGEIEWLSITEIVDQTFTRNDIKTDWADIIFDSKDTYEVEEAFPLLNTSYCDTGRISCGVSDSVIPGSTRPMLATALLD